MTKLAILFLAVIALSTSARTIAPKPSSKYNYETFVVQSRCEQISIIEQPTNVIQILKDGLPAIMLGPQECTVTVLFKGNKLAGEIIYVEYDQNLLGASEYERRIKGVKRVMSIPLG